MNISPKNKLEKITENTRVWTRNLDVTLPILGTDIPRFEEWVAWNCFSESHNGFDFAVYIDKEGRCILGLPSETPVRAVADGIVAQVYDSTYLGEYAVFINVEHGKKGSGLFSSYHHVKPLVMDGKYVKKGDVIATLYKDPRNDTGRLVHLHFLLSSGWDIRPRSVDPSDIFPEIKGLVVEPQGRKEFKILGSDTQPEIYIANFKNLQV